jgi:penicillin-binding protein 2
MQRDGGRQKVFTRRTALLAGGKLVLLSTLVGRMYYLQVIESKRYATLADENRINIRLLSPPRGRIVDRFGIPIAVNQQNHRVVLVPEAANPIEATLHTLGAIIDVGAGERRRILREARRRRGFIPITVRENLSWEEVSQIEVNTLDLPGVMIDVGQSRHYLHGEIVASVLGYVSAVSEDEIDGDPLLQLPGFRVGKAGIEKVYDRALRGTGGSSQVEVNSVGRVIKEVERLEGQPGTEVTLTLDLELQELASRLLARESAAAVVLDVHTGDVLAMVSTPSFDPNAFNRGISVRQWKALVSNSRAPLVNKAVTGQYAPGSTFKIVVALAALEKRVITPASRHFCSGSVKLGEEEFHCWKRGGHGEVNLNKGIAQSCDAYFYEIARRTGIDHIAVMARRLGLGQVLGVDLPGEKPGLIPTRAWKRASIGEPWHLGETLIAGIGQGAILATPLQLAVMTARIVNGGFAVTPHVTRDIIDRKGTIPRHRGGFEDLGLSSRHLALVRLGTDGVVNGRMGTARHARIAEPGFEMGGKTGTVQVRRITKSEREQGVRKNKDLPWKDRDHALFVGYAPVHAPRYAVSVVVEHGGGGSTVAAPIARDLLLATQRRSPVRAAAIARVGG